MNEIQKKRIEEAALEHAESIPQSDERKKYSREDFIAGAEYAISYQWTSIEEALPKEEFDGFMNVYVEVETVHVNIVCYLQHTIRVNSHVRQSM